MEEERRVRLSKYLSYLLRHHPEAAGLELEPGGWVRVADLLEGARQAGRELDRTDLQVVISQGDKPRFRLNESGDRIRANYGHSVPVHLELEPISPPKTLYHGTARRSLDSIRRRGLEARGRTMVHLAADRPTARATGGRHGRPVVLRVAAGELHRGGHPFYQPAEGIWLTPSVPPESLDVVEGK